MVCVAGMYLFGVCVCVCVCVVCVFQRGGLCIVGIVCVFVFIVVAVYCFAWWGDYGEGV